MMSLTRVIVSRPAVLLAIIALAVSGCGPAPLVRLRTHQGCPWCGPDRQLQVGQRSMGKSFYGDIWRLFWVDEKGREYDPEKVSKRVWAYLEEIGYTKKIDEAQRAGECVPWIRIVSVDPVVILMIPCQHHRFAGTNQLIAHGTRSALELSFVPESPMYFDEPMQWASPDLRQAPTTISFSKDGDAEIPLRHGKLTLRHEGESCLVHRE